MNKDTKVVLALITTLFLWSSSLVGIRIGLESFDPGPLALLRFISASLFMLIGYGYFAPRPRQFNYSDLLWMLVSGVIGFSLYNIMLNQGEETLDSGTTSFVLSQIPITMVILASIVLRERIHRIAWLGIFISIFGVFLIAQGKNQGNWEFSQGLIYLLIATFCHAGYSIINKPLLQRCSSLEFTTFAMWGGTIALLYYTPALIEQLPQASWLAILVTIYNGIFPAAIGYLTWSYVLHHLPASRVAMSLYSLPIATTLLSWLLLHEVPEALSFLGGCVSLVGAMIVNQSFRQKS